MLTQVYEQRVNVKTQALLKILKDTHFPRQTAPRAIWTMSYVMESYLLALLENTNKVANHSKRLTPPIQKVGRSGNRSVSALVSSAGVPPRTVGSREGIDTIHTLNYPNLSSDPQRFIRNLIFEKFHGKGIRRRK